MFSCPATGGDGGCGRAVPHGGRFATARREREPIGFRLSACFLGVHAPMARPQARRRCATCPESIGSIHWSQPWQEAGGKEGWARPHAPNTKPRLATGWSGLVVASLAAAPSLGPRHPHGSTTTHHWTSSRPEMRAAAVGERGAERVRGLFFCAGDGTPSAGSGGVKSGTRRHQTQSLVSDAAIAGGRGWLEGACARGKNAFPAEREEL